MASQKEKYRLWWSFLEMLRADATGAYAVDWSKYNSWGHLSQYKSFEQWWEDKGRFLQQPLVREVTSIPDSPPQNMLYVEVPLNRAPSRLMKRVRHIIDARFFALYPQLKESRRKTASFQAESGFTSNHEIRKDVYRKLLVLYRGVLRQHPSLTGLDLLKACNEYDEDQAKRGRKRDRLDGYYRTWDDDKPTGYDARTVAVMREKRVRDHRYDFDVGRVRSVLRNLRRAQRRLDTVLRAVEHGEFPGKVD